jgi:hypothetical protein
LQSISLRTIPSIEREKSPKVFLEKHGFLADNSLAGRRFPTVLQEFFMAQSTVIVAATVAKSAAKGSRKGITKPVAAATAPAAPKLAFTVLDGFRPSAGAMLFAHTDAFLTLSGLKDGGSYPKAKTVASIGARAVKYHTAQDNIEQTADGIRLTSKGAMLFAARTIDAEMAKGFSEVLSEGKANNVVKNQAGIKAI